MSWMTGYCDDCKEPNDYKHCWGYEKPYGLDLSPLSKKTLCDECMRKEKVNSFDHASRENPIRVWVRDALTGWSHRLLVSYERTADNPFRCLCIEHNIDTCVWSEGRLFTGWDNKPSQFE